LTVGFDQLTSLTVQ